MIDIIKGIVTTLGFNLDSINKLIISKGEFESNILKCTSTNKLFTEASKYRPLFELNKTKPKASKPKATQDKATQDKATQDKDSSKEKVVVDTTKAFMGFINRILKEWGLKLHVVKKTKRVQKEVVRYTQYNLNFYKNIDKFLPKE